MEQAFPYRMEIGSVPSQHNRPRSEIAIVTCQELVELLMDYLDGSLSDIQRARFEEHLAECSNCEAFLATYQLTVRIISRLVRRRIVASSTLHRMRV